MELANFVTGSYKGYSSAVNSRRAVNVFAVTDKKGGKPLSLQGTPGLKEFCRFGKTAQDLTTYTETDASNRFAETASTLTVTNLARSETAILLKDFTAAYFSGDFSFEFSVNVTSTSGVVSVFYPWLLSNRNAETIATHNTNNRDYLGVRLEVGIGLVDLVIQERNGATLSFEYLILTLDTTYYISVIRNESIGTFGRLTVNVYTDSARTILYTSGYLDLTEKEDFQYFYAGCGAGDAGFVMDFYGTSASYTVAGTATSYVPIRGLSNKIGNYMYAVMGADIVSITTAGVMVDIGTLDTTTGAVYFCDDGSAKLMLVDGTSGYSIVANVFAKIVDAQFPATPSDCTFQDGYFIASKGSTDEFYRSDLNDPTSWPGDYDSAEGLNDSLLRIRSTGRQIIALGTLSYEWWYNSGAPFNRIEGSRFKVGIGAAASLGESQGTLFWFTNTRRAVMSVGYETINISTPQIEYNWANYATVSDAIGFARVHEGHTFYTLTFPTQNITWEYDATEDLWHELESSEGNRWRANCHTYAFDKHFVGDFELSTIFEVDTDTYTDNGLAVKRIGDSDDFQAEGKMIFLGGLELTGEVGTGNAAAPGDDPQIGLSWSKDGGRTYSTERETGWGPYQEYTTRAIFNRLGRSRSWRFRFTFEEQCKFVLTGARFVPPPLIGNY